MTGHTPEQLRTAKAAFWDACRRDFAFFCAHCLTVRALVKVGRARAQWQWIPLRLNEQQMDLAREIVAGLAAGIPVRIIVLKCRKLGISTLVQALAYWLGAFVPGWVSHVVAHQARSTAEIAKIAIGFADNMKPVLATRLGAVKAGAGLKWPNGSEVQVFTQRSDDAARGSSPSLLHLSEVAFWGKKRKATTEEDALKAALGAIEQGVWEQDFDEPDEPVDEAVQAEIDGETGTGQPLEAPAESGGGTVVIIESTANGKTGAFWTRWNDSHKAGSAWVPKFYAWQSARKYQFAQSGADAALTEHARFLLRSGDRDGALAVFRGAGFDAEWCGRAITYDLTIAQVRWAVRQVQSFGGDLATFDQEYPLSAEHAFLASGRPVFAVARVEAIREPPETHASGRLRRDATDIEDAITDGGEWRFWHPPEFGTRCRYIVSADVAGGGGPDLSCIEVWDRVLRRQCAEFYSVSVQPDELAEEMNAVSYLYHDGDGTPACVAPEINNHGHAVVLRLLDLCHPRIYRRDVRAARSGKEGSWTTVYGFSTTGDTRPTMITELARDLRAGLLTLYSSRLQTEMHNFVFNANGRPDHMPGKTSDAIIATAIALFAVRYVEAEILKPAFNYMGGMLGDPAPGTTPTPVTVPAVVPKPEWTPGETYQAEHVDMGALLGAFR